MRAQLQNYYLVVPAIIILFHLLGTPGIRGWSFSELEQSQVVFTVNDTFDLGSIQIRSYQFSLKLDWVGSHARVRIQGGVVTGRTPNSLDINVVLDDTKTQRTFSTMTGLQKHYTFHSTSEYVVEVPPPMRPVLEGVQSLHNLTVDLKFDYLSNPEGTGLIYQIVFETFTPPTLNSTTPQRIPLLQDQFSWQVDQWSFGRYFFNTSLLHSLPEPQNVSLSLTVVFSGLTLEGWQLVLEQGGTQLQVRDNQTLQGIVVLDPDQLCELHVIVDPPQVSETKIINVNITTHGTVLPSSAPSSSSTHTLDPISQKRFNEGIILLQLGLVVLPLLTYYRVRRPTFKERDNPEEVRK
ncbi:MAG: hypothetical protein ACFFBD_28440 [Candidatus Hodarchaeota archaeon]